MSKKPPATFEVMMTPHYTESCQVRVPKHGSFEQFLLQEARVPGGGGVYKKYSFAGREALLAVVRVVDQIISEKLADAEVSLAGGAQFGKTILELNLAAYITSQQFRNFGLYLPDDDLVEGIVDSKFRPDVVDQIGWFAEMVQVGKALNKSGRAVNRKGAFLVTDGNRRSVGMIRGLGKVPTTFSMDVGAMDEVDDIDPKMMKFVRGRLTAGDLRFIFKTGTQRVHGRGMNKAWKDGRQGVFTFKCPNAACGKIHNAEEEFPQIVRLVAGDEVTRLKSKTGTGESLLTSAATLKLTRSDGQNEPESQGLATLKRRERRAPSSEHADLVIGAPKLTWAGDFRVDGSDETVATHSPANEYYLACVNCGAELDRTQPLELHRVPALIRQRKWSFRISQLAIAAIDLSQIVARFQSAVADPEEMIVFRCDVLGLPQSTAQALTPATLDRARGAEVFDLAPTVRAGHTAFGGLDMGDRCWLFAREVPTDQRGGVCRAATDHACGAGTLRQGHPAADVTTAWGIYSTPLPTSGTPDADLVIGAPRQYSRLLAAERMAAGDVVARAQACYHRLGLTALFIDERPLVNEARTLALALNGLQTLQEWPRIPNPHEAYVALPGGLTWDGRNARWLNLKCAVVRFTKSKLGAGIEQGIIFFEEGGRTKFIPCIACNRFETIDRVVREFLTPAEGVVEVTTGNGLAGRAIRENPALLLPRKIPGQTADVLDLVDAQLITGSERVKAADGSLGDYVDGCENHFLLADGYSKLAEIVGAQAAHFACGPIIALPHSRRSQVLAARANRTIEG